MGDLYVYGDAYPIANYSNGNIYFQSSSSFAGEYKEVPSYFGPTVEVYRYGEKIGYVKYNKDLYYYDEYVGYVSYGRINSSNNGFVGRYTGDDVGGAASAILFWDKFCSNDSSINTCSDSSFSDINDEYSYSSSPNINYGYRTNVRKENKFVEFIQCALGLLAIIVIIWIIIGDFVTTQFRLLDLKMMTLGMERVEYNYLEGNYEVINGPYTDNLPHEKFDTGIFDNNLTTSWISSKDIIGECIDADFLVPVNIKYIDFSLGMDENKENTIYEFPTKLLFVFDDSRYLEFNLEIDYGTDTTVRNWQSACIEIPGGVMCKEMKIYILDHEHLENNRIDGRVKKCAITNITPYSDDTGASTVPEDIS